MSLLGTVYIISKGRPQCRTAQTLERIKFPGEWFIVCGTNDETLDQYIERWGGRVLTFDFEKQLETTDTMDPFGFGEMASGACPVRNATRGISRERGELRHWQLDDDYTGFQIFDSKTGKRPTVKDGAELYERMERIAEFGHECGLANVGFTPAGIAASRENARNYSPRVFNAHNMPSDPELFVRWVGRMNDDLINAINVYRTGRGPEFSFNFVSMNMPATQSENGGLSELYREEGTVRKTAYAVMAAPGAVKLVERFGRYHHAVDWKFLVPKIVHSKYRRR